MARPRKPDSEKYDQKIEVYVRRETKAWVEHRAAMQGQSVSRYMRELINGTNERGLLVSILHHLQTVHRRLETLKEELDQGFDSRFLRNTIEGALAHVEHHGYELTQAITRRGSDNHPDGEVPDGEVPDGEVPDGEA
jgi:hypothetical protein